MGFGVIIIDKFDQNSKDKNILSISQYALVAEMVYAQALKILRNFFHVGSTPIECTAKYIFSKYYNKRSYKLLQNFVLYIM